MKSLFITFLLVLFHVILFSQSWNPYVNQGTISPAPLLPLEFEGRGTASFNVGNNGSSTIPLVANQEMGLVISLINGVPDSNDPLEALSGSWVGYFDWIYFSEINSFQGKQNQDIPGQSMGTIDIAYRVTFNTPQSISANGFNVNIQPPPFTNGSNAADDDQVSAYTYVRAIDFGDAPLSYGIASHEIRLFKNSQGQYTEYVYMGAAVDAEPGYLVSADANGDDEDGLNDEDGVVFGEMIKGASTSIQVTTTAVDNSIGFLQAWIDWNGDGDFLDAGERIVTNQLVLPGTHVHNLNVSVPQTAMTGHTFARFRVGPLNQGPSGQAGHGEVEDYKILVLDNLPGLILYKEGIFDDENGNLFADLGESIVYEFTVYNSGNQTIKQIEIVDTLLSDNSIMVTPSQLMPGEMGTAVYIMPVTQDLLNEGGVYNLA